ncbi:hypothetical protein ES703_41900 [subsurface metagenome]
MSRRKVKKFRSKTGKRVPKSTRDDSVAQIETEEVAKRQQYFEIFLIAALLAFGIYQSVLYFGYKVVPISDFPDIVRTGHELLSFKVPTRFKQAPVVGVLQASLSHLVGGQHPDLTAGWLLNAILHPLNLVLLWLVGKRVVGKSAIWFAIIAILNHWVIYMLTEPIIETSLLFFSLLTFYLIFKRSNWCYVAASVTTMVRYEGAALILAAFVIDMIYRKSKRERIRAFLYSALASVPLALWMLGTVLSLGREAETTHYLKVLFTKEYAERFADSAKNRTGIVRHMKLLWTVGFYPLFRLTTEAKGSFEKLTVGQIESIRTFFSFSQIMAIAAGTLGAIYGLCKRQWKILAFLIFFVPYFVLHAMYPYPLQRFHTNIFWIALLMCLFGFQSVWKLIDGKGRVPKGLVLILQALVAIVSIVWLVSLVPYLPKISRMSPKSASLPYVAMILVGLIFAARIFIYRARHFLRELSILALVCLIIVSNQFTLVRLVGDWQRDRDKEFKQLADWYIANAKPGEKLGVYMFQVVRIFAPEHAENIVILPKADNQSEFVKACYEQDITYVVWATREGLSDDHWGYRRFGLYRNIAHLRTAKDIGPYQFVAQVGWKGGYVNIFRLHRPAGVIEPGVPDS